MDPEGPRDGVVTERKWAPCAGLVGGQVNATKDRVGPQQEQRPGTQPQARVTGRPAVVEAAGLGAPLG